MKFRELDPWHIMNMLGFVTPYFVPIILMIMAALAIFQALIRVGLDICKFLIDVSVTNILDTKNAWSGGMLVSVYFSAHRENGAELHINTCFLS